ncbi:hypothetical protein NIES4102_10070 [Chondrocystis sp. NIES-4102]|nr:hypothetical protein NIES4102_10070 [Chondrocystis sp. NIES-4102]
MSLSLQLKLQSDNQVIVINSINREQRKVTLAFIQKITRNSMNLLVQYKTYEIIINAQNIWNQIVNFDFQVEAAKEVDIERKFQKIMTPGSWIEITEHDKKQYQKALSITSTYNPNTGVVKTAKVINRLQELQWEIIDMDQEYVTIYNHKWQTPLLIPNHSQMSQKTFVEIINKAKLSISEFFSSL